MAFNTAAFRELVSHRQIWGLCLGQFAVHSTLTFFLTWFPSYLITARHISWLQAGLFAVLPYAAAFCGILLAGWASDRLLARGFSLSFARKAPVITGLVLATVIVAANWLRGWQRGERCRHVRAGGVGEDDALGDFTGECDHLLAQGGDDDRRQRAEAVLGAEFFHEAADIAQRLAGDDAHTDVGRAMRDTDSEAEAAAGDFVHHRGALGEIQQGALIDRGDGGAERDGGGVPGKCLAKRHVPNMLGNRCPQIRGARSPARFPRCGGDGRERRRG